MFYYRITKYNPTFRDKDGTYHKKEWTSYSDIGRVYEKQLFTLESYLKTEAAYCSAIIDFMNCLDLTQLRVRSLEMVDFNKNSDAYSDKVKNLLNENSTIERDALLLIVPLVLREIVWFKLESKEMFVHFGYDYYMYIGSKSACEAAVDTVRESGLFVESYESPYL